MYKFTKYICATYTITVVKMYFCTMIHKLMWVYFGVDWTNLVSYVILQLMQMLLQWNQCKIVGEGAQEFWKRGQKYKIVKNIPLYIYIYIYTHFFFFFLRVYLVGETKKWEDRKNWVFPHVCLVEGIEK